MSLQLKLTIPIVFGAIIFSALIHLLWAPSQYAKVREQAITELTKEFEAMDTGLIRNLLENDYAALYATLDEQQTRHGDSWHYLSLYDNNGKRLYPFAYQEHLPHDHPLFFHFTHSIQIKNSDLGRIDLHVDWKERFEAQEAQIRELEGYLLLAVLLTIFLIFYWQRRVVLTPIFGLENAIERLSRGDYNYPLPADSKDEIGQLTQGFASMRSKLLQAGRELNQAHQEIKLTLEEVSRKNIALHEEVEHRKRIEARLNEMATHDELTGLPNRYLLKEEVFKCTALARRYDHKVGIMFVDLDDFKSINDNHGHKAGDEVLVEVSGRISSEVRQGDTVGRVGGDEFIIVLPDCGTLEDLEDIGERILNNVRRPFESIPIPRIVGASIGISIYPDDGEEIDELLNKADSAMYQNKQNRKCKSAS